MAESEVTIGKFWIAGEPHGQTRVRFARRGQGVQTYKARSQLDAETAFILQLNSQLREFSVVEKGRALAMEVCFFMPVPKSRAKKIKRGDPHCVKPDLDNLLKHIKDCMNRRVWHDDCQVAATYMKKIYEPDAARVGTMIILRRFEAA